MAQIKNQYEVSTSDYDREKLMERLARLSGGVAVIKVGAATEAEMKEKKLRVEDALNATKAAVEEGIVAGGGTAYVQAGIAAEKVVTELEGDEKTGAAIVAKALQAPLMQIAANAGLEGAVILNQVRGSEIPGYGFDAAKEEYCDMIAAGIVDPTKVCRSALENAASVASTVLTTEAMVVSIPEPPRRLPPRRTWAACTKSSPHFRIKYTSPPASESDAGGRFFFQAPSAFSYAAMAFQERFAVARGFYLADAGDFQKILRRARGFRRHVRKRRVGEYNIGRHALRRSEARALRLERREETVRAGRRGGCCRALPAAFFLSALRRRLKVYRHGDLPPPNSTPLAAAVGSSVKCCAFVRRYPASSSRSIMASTFSAESFASDHTLRACPARAAEGAGRGCRAASGRSAFFSDIVSERFAHAHNAREDHLRRYRDVPAGTFSGSFRSFRIPRRAAGRNNRADTRAGSRWSCSSRS